jgi:hypothetical protein
LVASGGGDGRFIAGSHAVSAEVVLDTLADVLHEEARLAHELVGAPRLHAIAALGRRVGLCGLFFVFVLLIIAGGDAVLEDRVQISLDVVGIDQLVVFVFFLRSAALLYDGGCVLFLLLVLFGLVSEVLVGEVLVDDVLVELFVDVLVEFRFVFVEVFDRFVEVLVEIVVRHAVPARLVPACRSWPLAAGIIDTRYPKSLR